MTLIPVIHTAHLHVYVTLDNVCCMYVYTCTYPLYPGHTNMYNVYVHVTLCRMYMPVLCCMYNNVYVHVTLCRMYMPVLCCMYMYMYIYRVHVHVAYYNMYMYMYMYIWTCYMKPHVHVDMYLCMYLPLGITTRPANSFVRRCKSFRNWKSRHINFSSWFFVTIFLHF